MSRKIQDFLKDQTGVMIASIFPVECRAERPFNGKTVYILPAVESQEDVKSLTIGHAFEHVYVGNRVYNDQPVFAEDIAQDLLREFMSGLAGTDSGNGPGIWICSEQAPTIEEITAARAKQTAYFEYLVNQANEMHVRGDGNNIQDIHRRAARWLGYESFPWIERMTQKSLKDCPFCFSKIDSRATRCPSCRGEIEAMPEDSRKKVLVGKVK